MSSKEKQMENQELRKADENGLFQQEKDLIFQRNAIKLFAESFNLTKYIIEEPENSEGQVDLTHCVDGVVYLDEIFQDDVPLGMIEAKAREGFRWEQPTHKAQIGLDKLVQAYTYYCQGWDLPVSQTKVLPLVYLVGVYPKKADGTTDTTAKMEVYGIDLSAFSTWLFPRLRAFKRDPLANHRQHGDIYIRLVKNVHQIPHKEHYCLHIPMDWFVKIEPGVTSLDTNIKALHRWKREAYLNEKYHDQKDMFGEYLKEDVVEEYPEDPSPTTIVIEGDDVVDSTVEIRED